MYASMHIYTCGSYEGACHVLNVRDWNSSSSSRLTVGEREEE